MKKSLLLIFSIILLIIVFVGIASITSLKAVAMNGLLMGEKFEQPDGSYRCMGDGEKCDI